MELSKVVREGLKVSVKDGDEVILMAWSELADRGVGLECSMLEKIDQVSDLLVRLGQRLKDNVARVRDLIAEQRRNDLSNFAWNLIEGLGGDAEREVLEKLCSYVVKHLLALNSPRRRFKRDLGNDDVERYVETVFVNRAFAEYEVYSALLRLGAPALPRLQLWRGRELVCEVDVVAAPRRGELWVVEVTTRRELEDKLESLMTAIELLRAKRAIVVSSKPEEVRRQLSEYFECYSFSEWASGRMLG